MAVFLDVAPCSLVEVLTDVSEVLAASIVMAMTHRPDGGGRGIFETSVNFYQTTRRNNPEGSHLRTRCRKNLKSHLINSVVQGLS
jgi:hypothetical protein